MSPAKNCYRVGHGALKREKPTVSPDLTHSYFDMTPPVHETNWYE